MRRFWNLSCIDFAHTQVMLTSVRVPRLLLSRIFCFSGWVLIWALEHQMAFIMYSTAWLSFNKRVWVPGYLQPRAAVSYRKPFPYCKLTKTTELLRSWNTIRKMFLVSPLQLVLCPFSKHVGNHRDGETVGNKALLHLFGNAFYI